MKTVIICNSIGKLDNGKKLILFPSRWTAGVKSPSRPFAFYPYELAYLSSLLKRELDFSEFEIKMLDPNLLGLDKKETIAYINSYTPDYLIMEPSAIDSKEVFEIFSSVKKNNSTINIVGGAFAYAEPLECSKFADFVVPGEYELVVLEIIKSGSINTSEISLQGLYPNNSKKLVDPNDLPWPEDNDISRLDYTEPGCDYRMIQLYASRGCNLACTFCVVPSYYGQIKQNWRMRDPKDVVAEIQYLVKKYDGYFNGIFFNEEAHNSSMDWVAELCEEIIKNQLNFLKYDAMCVYYNFNDELFKLMKKAGYHQIRFGIESFGESTGKVIHKKVNYDKLKTMLEKAKKYGFVTYGTSIVGAQDSSFEDDLLTHNRLCYLRDDLKLLDKWQVSIATPQPGTPFYNWAKANNYLINYDLNSYDGRQAVCSYNNYSSNEIEHIFKIYNSREKISLEKARL